MRLLLSALLVLSLAGRDAGAQDAPARDETRTRGRIIGLLDLPELVGQPCGASPPATIDLYAAPSASAPPIGSLAMHVVNRAADGSSCDTATLVVRHRDGRVEPLPNRESGYEIDAAIVRARSGPWYRIDAGRGSAWIRRDNPRDFLPYPELLTDRLAHTQEGWDERLWPGPGRGAPALIPAAWREWSQFRHQAVNVDVLAVERIGAEPWVHVRLKPSCGDEPSTLAPWTGWLPAYTTAGEPSLWFYSRGC